MYSVGQAARAVGKAKSTISRDGKDGANFRREQSGRFMVIDSAELHRSLSGSGRSERRERCDERSIERFATPANRYRNGGDAARDRSVARTTR